MASVMLGYAETGLGSAAAYVLERLSDGAFWSVVGTPGWVMYVVGDIADYAVPATEVGATGIYTATNPDPNTPCNYLLVKKAGASLAVTDLTTGLRWQDRAGDPFTISSQILAILTSGNTTVTVASTVPADITEAIEIYCGDDYLLSLGNNLSWNIDTEEDYTGATATLTIYLTDVESSGSYDAISCTLTAITDGYRVEAELAHSITNTLSRRTHRYEVKVIKTGGLVLTRITGKIKVK